MTARHPVMRAVPAELAEMESRVRASLIEAIVIADDSLTERYLDGDVPTMDELEPALAELMIEGRIVPVTCGSATRGVGVDRLATLLDEIAVSRPIPALMNGNETFLDRDPDGEPIMRAFKVIVDPYVGRIVVMEVDLGHDHAGHHAGQRPHEKRRTTARTASPLRRETGAGHARGRGRRRRGRQAQ